MKKSKSIVTLGLQNVVQNLRNPLTAVLLSVEKLKEPGLPEEERKYLLNLIEKNSHVIENEIEELCSNLSNLDMKAELYNPDE